MPLMEWSDSMSVGVREIDADHRHLVSMINQLFDAMQQGAGRAKLRQTLEGLIEYTDAHFKHEERLFILTSYPEGEAHKKEHDNLKRQVVEMKFRFEAQENDAITIEILTFLKHWLVNHTTGSDKRYSQHLNAHGIV
jgi:hemerythrin-like metal-binding protein